MEKYHIVDLYDDYSADPGYYDPMVYRAKEVDKVIADLEESHKKEVEQLLILNREQAVNANQLRDSMEQVIRHHKWKRCMDKARIAQDDWHLHNSLYAMGHQEFEKRKCKFYEEWHERWLRLADKFKE